MARPLALCFRPADCAWAARALRERLDAALGAGLVFDAGSDVGALEGAELVLALVGRKWTGRQGEWRSLDQPDDLVRRTLEQAVVLGIPIVPVLVDGTRLPPELPPMLSTLASRRVFALRADDRFETDSALLLDEVRAVLGGASPSPPQASLESSPPPPTTRSNEIPSWLPPAASSESEMFSAEELNELVTPGSALEDRLSLLPPPSSRPPAADEPWIRIATPEGAERTIREVVASLAARRKELRDPRPVSAPFLRQSLRHAAKEAMSLHLDFFVCVSVQGDRANIRRKVARRS